MDKNYVVTKSNYFIMNSSYDLSLEEQKLILTLASMVQPDDEEFKPYIFRIADFMTLLGVENQSKYTAIPKITKELMKKVFEIEEEKKVIQTAWLSGAIYEKGTGYVTLKFNPDLKPYMIKLNDMFTQYKLANILSMKSKYSPRIYEILKCNEFKKQGYIEMEIKDLRKLLKAEDIYPLYADFKRKIIAQAQKELKKLSDIDFEFEEIKTGRKVTSLRFYIKGSQPKPIEEKTKKTKKAKKTKTVEDKVIEPKVIEPKVEEPKVEEPKVEEPKVDKKKKKKKKKFKYTKEDYATYCEIINKIKVICGEKISLKNAEIFYSLASKHELGKKYPLKFIEEIAEYSNSQNIQGFVGWFRRMLVNYQRPIKSAKKTKFNNFKGRDYDYDALEKKLLGWD